MRKLAGWLFIADLITGCASSRPAPAQAPVASSVPVAPAASGAAPEAVKSGPLERSEWREHFAAEHVAGTIALLDNVEGKLSCSDVALCQKPTIPASTFKIPNSMIALETGVVDDAESRLPWDGKYYSVQEWNRDNTLRTAVQVSCVPCFQSMARKVGDQRMHEWLTKLEYGNKDSSGGVDQFWLTGGLRISPVEQVDFLRRFDQGMLPISKRTSETVRDIITLDVGRTHTLLGKTGMALPSDVNELAAWFVGWLELGSRKVYFATLITSCEPGIDAKPARRAVTERVLRSMGLLPGDATRPPSG
jgi:beta-lactamase class D